MSSTLAFDRAAWRGASHQATARLSSKPAAMVGEVAAGLTVHRIESLYALGHDASTIKQAGALSVVVASRNTQVPWWYATRVRAAYRELENVAGVTVWVRVHARLAGLLPPAAWDDPGTLEWPEGWVCPLPPDPREVVDMVAIRRFVGGDTKVVLTEREKCVAAAVMLDEGWTRTAAARRLRTRNDRLGRLAAAARCPNDI